jgi:hypothetical protein
MRNNVAAVQKTVTTTQSFKKQRPSSDHFHRPPSVGGVFLHGIGRARYGAWLGFDRLEAASRGRHLAVPVPPATGRRSKQCGGVAKPRRLAPRGSSGVRTRFKHKRKKCHDFLWLKQIS